MRTAMIAKAKDTQQGGLAVKGSILKLGLPVAAAIFLATRFYFVSEALVFLMVLTVLFAVATAVAILVMLIQECGRWSLSRFKEVNGARVSSLGARAEHAVVARR